MASDANSTRPLRVDGRTIVVPRQDKAAAVSNDNQQPLPRRSYRRRAEPVPSEATIRVGTVVTWYVNFGGYCIAAGVICEVLAEDNEKLDKRKIGVGYHPVGSRLEIRLIAVGYSQMVSGLPKLNWELASTKDLEFNMGVPTPNFHDNPTLDIMLPFEVVVRLDKCKLVVGKQMGVKTIQETACTMISSVTEKMTKKYGDCMGQLVPFSSCVCFVDISLL